jgi:hypothetical protein
MLMSFLQGFCHESIVSFFCCFYFSLSSHASTLKLNGDAVTSICTQLLGKDHICRHYDKKADSLKEQGTGHLITKLKRSPHHLTKKESINAFKLDGTISNGFGINYLLNRRILHYFLYCRGLYVFFIKTHLS